MPRAEAGSNKAIGNSIKAKGLGRLRWYCQACERQMRDENGFKCHVQSESHVRQVLLIGEDPKKYIEDYSKQFVDNFVNMLKTTHGEKKVQVNQFYQQVIQDKNHIHMNATKWKSLSQFAAHLGREGICRVEETEKGLFVSWIDNSPDTMRKREAVMKKERQDKGDEEREQQQIQEQVERARQNAEKEEEISLEAKMLQRKEGEKVKLNIGFGSKSNADAKPEQTAPRTESPEHKETSTDHTTPATATPEAAPTTESPAPASSSDATPAPPAEAAPAPAPAPKISMSFGGDKKPKNVFAAAAKKNPLAGKKGPVMEAPKKMTEQERIMKAEMEATERKRSRGPSGFSNAKRPKVS